MFRFVLLLGAFLALCGMLHSSVATAGTYEGVASCAGSTCHGRNEGDGKVVRQDELRIWQDQSSQAGAHSRAYAALKSARGERIAASLGLGRAENAPACLGCHSTNAPAGARGDRWFASDGVGCESCHGASSGWISTHYAVPASHASNVASGLIPLERPQVRARVCLDCHFGSDRPGQFVTHSMMAAGHPRISFELDLFSGLQAHYDIDGDYVRRKGRLDSVQLWAVGQAEAIRRSTGLFRVPELATEGIFPQFYFYDCHSCHRAISDKPGAVRKFETNPGRPIPFGNPPFNDENMIMLSAAASVLAPAEAARFDAAVRNFHAAMAKGRPQTVAAAQALGAAASGLSDAIAARRYDANTAFRIVAEISSKAISPRFTDYTGSAQAVMAIDTLLNAMVRDGHVTIGAAAGIRAQINKAYAAVSSPGTYNPPAFRAALASAASAIEALR